MPRDRFASTGTKRIDISDGDWIVVKEGLNAADQRKQSAMAVVPAMLNGIVVDRIDWSRYELERTALWLVEWSLTKSNGNGIPEPMPATMDSLKALEPADFNEINDAVYKHMLEWRAKKLPSPKGVTAQSDDNSSATLP